VQSGKFEGPAEISEESEVFFLEVCLDQFQANMYISTNNPGFEPVYAVCINRDPWPSDN
jgi:hypothetical protein